MFVFVVNQYYIILLGSTDDFLSCYFNSVLLKESLTDLTFYSLVYIPLTRYVVLGYKQNVLH